MSRPLIVGITGASGSLYGIRLLQMLRQLEIPSHLILSEAAAVAIAHETDWKIADIKALATHVHEPGDIAAAPASGSFRTRGMVIAPCSVRTMSEIAHGITGSLLTRAADVMLKERRRLVLMVRETPLHTGHLRSLTALSEMGAIIAPPVPALYARPRTLEEMIDYSIARVLDLFDIDQPELPRWGLEKSAEFRHPKSF